MRTCPLCGKSKPVEALFCEECTHRMHADYEVRLPTTSTQGEREIDQEQELYQKQERGSAQQIDQEQELYRSQEPELETKLEPESETARELEVGQYQEKVKKQVRSKWLSGPVLILLALLLLVGSYAVFNKTVRKGNLERRGWDTALNMNSVEGYLDYMATFPSGAHFDEAHEALRKLKSEEAMQWERLKTSSNTAELRDFLSQHPDIPFAPLVEKRLDSLSWAGAARANTPEAYSEYIHLSQQGQLRGDYVNEARQKLKELLSNLVESVITDSIPG
jgi:hypothetical protein